MLTKIISFFSTKSVRHKIIANSLSECQLFSYFYIVLIFDNYNFVQSWLSIAGKSPRIDDVVQMWGGFFYIVIGLVILFMANGGAKGKNFLTKYFSYSFTVGIKYFIAFLICGFLPIFIHVSNIPVYNIFVFLFLDTLMVVNIAYQIYLTH